jgi:hypothetical protein
MSLESKAKTVVEILKANAWYDNNGLIPSNFLQTKYVPLVDYQVLSEKAQKLEVLYGLQVEEIERQKEINRKLEAKIAEAKRTLSIILENGEVKCFYENGLIPCKANCARSYEQLCERIYELKAILSVGNKPIPTEGKQE